MGMQVLSFMGYAVLMLCFVKAWKLSESFENAAGRVDAHEVRGAAGQLS